MLVNVVFCFRSNRLLTLVVNAILCVAVLVCVIQSPDIRMSVVRSVASLSFACYRVASILPIALILICGVLIHAFLQPLVLPSF